MGKTPLYDALTAHRRGSPAPFHMPGHKGRCPYPQWADLLCLDVTELPDTGNLYVGGDVIAQAEALWAAAWGFGGCQFLTCGSTQGLHSALLLCARGGKEVLVDRCCHRSVYNALALFDLRPAWLSRIQQDPIDPEQVAAALDRAGREGKSITTVCITSPTYYGVLSDIPAIAQVCRSRGARLVVDGAHGCHLPFLWEENPFCGADLVVASAHKTLPALGQGAVLLAGEGSFTLRDLGWAASVTGTSSPSYPVMASLDLARDWMESREGLEGWRQVEETVDQFKARFPALRDRVDPYRLTLTVNSRALDGFGAKARLEEAGVFPELADRDHLVFLFSPQNTQEDAARLGRELDRLTAAFPGVWDPPMAPETPPEPEEALSPAQALTAPRRTLPLDRAEGETAARQVAPYPPGVPVIAPGERITKKCLSYLRKVGYNMQESIDVVC